MAKKIERKSRFDDKKLEMELNSIVDQMNDIISSFDIKMKELESEITDLKKIKNENLKV